MLESLGRVGAVLRGHFKLSSGRHSDLYIEKFRAFEHPELARDLGSELAKRFKGEPVNVVLSPAVGAVILGFVVALDLGARFIFAEREDGRLKLRRGFGIEEGERVVVIEDVITTGESVQEVIELVPPGTLSGIGCLADRRSQSLRPVESLAKISANSWVASSCPMCARGLPVESPGSRHLK